jgi:hypothetical protein
VELRRLAVLVISAACAASCTTTRTSTPPGLAEAVVLRSQPVRAWDVVAVAGRAGSIVRFEEPGTSGRAWFSVRNVHAQELGIVDVEGRAWRYRPHQPDPEWLGSGTVLSGASLILDAGPTAQLVEIAVDEIAARGPH